MKEVKNFIKAKKRKKIIKKVMLIASVVSVAGFIFITKAPIFNIKSIVLRGNVTIANETILSGIRDKIGLNIFTINQKDIKEKVLENRYVSTVEIKRKGINTLEVNITEEAPVYYIDKGVELYPFISKNREAVYLSSLDLSNITNIIGYIGDVEIFFGDDNDLHNKMENVYRIMLADNIDIKKGYINVSFKGSPVVKIEEVKEDTSENNPKLNDNIEPME